MIATLAELKTELGLTDTADDAKLTALMERIQGRFEDFCARGFELAAVTGERHNGGMPFVNLFRFPVVSIAEAKYVAPDGAETVYAEGDDFVVSYSRGRLIRLSGAEFPDGVENIRVSYTGGYTAAGATPSGGALAMPEGLRRAFVMQVFFEFKNREQIGKASVSAGGASVSLAPARLLPDVEETLAPYRRI